MTGKLDTPAGRSTGPESTFEVVLWGYHKGQVEECLAELEQQITTLYAAGEELRSELARLEEERSILRSRLCGVPPTVHHLGEQVQTIVGLAEREAAEVREAAYAELASARTEAGRIIAKAERAAGRIADDCEVALQERRRQQQREEQRALFAARRKRDLVAVEARQQADQIITAARQRADQLLATARERAARLTAEATVDRTFVTAGPS